MENYAFSELSEKGTKSLWSYHNVVLSLKRKNNNKKKKKNTRKIEAIITAVFSEKILVKFQVSMNIPLTKQMCCHDLRYQRQKNITTRNKEHESAKYTNNIYKFWFGG